MSEHLHDPTLLEEQYNFAARERRGVMHEQIVDALNIKDDRTIASIAKAVGAGKGEVLKRLHTLIEGYSPSRVYSRPGENGRAERYTTSRVS